MLYLKRFLLLGTTLGLQWYLLRFGMTGPNNGTHPTPQSHLFWSSTPGTPKRVKQTNWTSWPETSSPPHRVGFSTVDRPTQTGDPTEPNRPTSPGGRPRAVQSVRTEGITQLAGRRGGAGNARGACRWSCASRRSTKGSCRWLKFRSPFSEWYVPLPGVANGRSIGHFVEGRPLMLVVDLRNAACYIYCQRH